MDAADDDADVKLQRVSSDLLTVFDERLGPLLREIDEDGKARLRSHVSLSEASFLTSTLLDPFQELPQLLDPHLAEWIPRLTIAYLQYSQILSRSREFQDEITFTSGELSLTAAISKILYTFCKIRGEKIIVRFLNNEARYLELLLTRLEEASRSTTDTSGLGVGSWCWEERYIVLLWLSHLILAPFDLVTLSSVDYQVNAEGDIIPGFEWPPQVPGIALRLLPIAIQALESAGKERDAAKLIIVRLGMRKDMQELGILDAIMTWAQRSLQKIPQDVDIKHEYQLIGVLSLLAGLFSTGGSDAAFHQYMRPVFDLVQSYLSDEGGSRLISSARKFAIKITRSIAIHRLQDTELVETFIGHMLESVGDKDTPVRLAASKALSMITQKLDTEMASQVVHAVLEALLSNVRDIGEAGRQDVTSANPQEWHGLMMTLSHLLYRRSPPASDLADVIKALLAGLTFEQRSSTGSSIGGNVRDAACFGLWSIARRYTSSELLAVSTGEDVSSILQTIATQLVVTACLDPEGNIRRGSSAALQELIGRHPDKVSQGISVVQTVDYHAVALRTRAMLDVALGATKLDDRYGQGLLTALVDWRGTGDAKATSRRAAARSYGRIAAQLSGSSSNEQLPRLQRAIRPILRDITNLQPRQVDERHGLILSLASTLDHVLCVQISSNELIDLRNLCLSLLKEVQMYLAWCKTTRVRRPELIAEAMSELIVSAYPLLDITLLHSELPKLVAGSKLLGYERLSLDEEATKWQDGYSSIDFDLGKFRLETVDCLGQWLQHDQSDTIEAASHAALVVLLVSSDQQRTAILKKWAHTIGLSHTKMSFQPGFLYAMIIAYRLADTSSTDGDIIWDTIVSRWKRNPKDVNTQVAILKALSESEMLRSRTTIIVEILRGALDNYTTTERGDVGSHVRSQALQAITVLWSWFIQLPQDQRLQHAVVTSLLPQCLRLAGERLDKVRADARSALQVVLEPSFELPDPTVSIKEYFTCLLEIGTSSKHFDQAFVSSMSLSQEQLSVACLAGFVSSADRGVEDHVLAARDALIDYCTKSQEHLDRICDSLFRSLKSSVQPPINDRILLPTLEIIAFLFSLELYGNCRTIDFKSLCLQVQKAVYKSSHPRKIESSIKVYGGIAGMQNVQEQFMTTRELDAKREVGMNDAKKRLAGLMLHPWPRIRNAVVDELWCLFCITDEHKAKKLKSIDWTTASNDTITALTKELDLIA